MRDVKIESDKRWSEELKVEHRLSGEKERSSEGKRRRTDGRMRRRRGGRGGGGGGVEGEGERRSMCFDLDMSLLQV